MLLTTRVRIARRHPHHLRLNSSVQCEPIRSHLSESNALDLLRDASVVVDCSDNPGTRYLVNDACVLLVYTLSPSSAIYGALTEQNLPLVSGAALRGEGQLSVYHHRGGPCYRCVFPAPPPAASVTSCSDGGVLGATTGALGCLQAAEVIKIVCGAGDVLAQRLLLLDIFAATCRTVRLRPRRADCAVCGDAPTITSLATHAFACRSEVSAAAPASSAAAEGAPRLPRITAAELHAQLPDAVVVDVRPLVEFGICALPGSVNTPMPALPTAWADIAARVAGGQRLVFVCRRGNDSQDAVRMWVAAGGERAGVCDLVGGLQAWAKFDPTFPIY
jgi:adenylyltransferase/sulfurtransferase